MSTNTLLSANYVLLHLSLLEGVGAVTIHTLVTNKPAHLAWHDLYLLTAGQLQSYCGLSLQKSSLIVQGLSSRDQLEKELELIERYAISWCTLLDDRYPDFLRAIYAPPAVLYWQGTLASACKNNLAIVGSRAVGHYGVQVIENMVPDFVASGLTIVSGGARGADGVAHTQTLRYAGKTVAVLGSGLLKPYPSSNQALFNAIVEQGGALVSIFPLQAGPVPGNFPARNRVIAGLSSGCLVIQAAAESGALITAKYALEQGRDVFAVPGDIMDPLSAGCHELIRQGALLVTKSEDVLSEFGLSFSSQHLKPLATPVDVAVKQEQSDTQELVGLAAQLRKLCKAPKSLDELLVATSLEYADLSTQLFELQLSGVLKQNFMGMWELALR